MVEFAELASVRALATALLHFLWQGSLIALAAAVLMRVARTAAVRYGIGIGALVAMLAAPAVTIVVQLDSSSGAAASAGSGLAPSASVQSAAVEPTQEAARGFATVDAGLWPAAGVFAWRAAGSLPDA